MYPVAGVAEPRNEVDAIQWVPIERAASVLTYTRDRELLRTFADTQRRAVSVER